MRTSGFTVWQVAADWRELMDKTCNKLTIKLKTLKLLQLQQAAFSCSYNKNANEGCNSCARASFIVSFIASFIALVISS